MRDASRVVTRWQLALAWALASCLLPLARAHADERVPSPEAQSAALQAASGASTDTSDADNLLYFVLYAGGTFPAAGRVVQHSSIGASRADDEVSGTASWLGGFALALIPPRFYWFAVEWHAEFGVAALESGSVFHSQAGLTFRATVPVRYFNVNVGAGPILTTFLQDYSDPSPTPGAPADFTQWDGALGLRLLAGIHFLVSPDVRLFLDYRYDLYLNMIGQPPKTPAPGASAFRGNELDGLGIHSAVGGIEFNVPDFQQLSSGGKLPYVVVPTGVVVLSAIFAVVSAVRPE